MKVSNSHCGMMGAQGASNEGNTACPRHFNTLQVRREKKAKTEKELKFALVSQSDHHCDISRKFILEATLSRHPHCVFLLWRMTRLQRVHRLSLPFWARQSSPFLPFLADTASAHIVFSGNSIILAGRSRDSDRHVMRDWRCKNGDEQD